jgi:formylglycine-generating enzyme required for sulfatase activity
MTSPSKAPPGSTPASVSDEAKTIWLDLSTPSVEASPQSVDSLMDKGSTLNGRYRLLDLIGEGRMSRVFKAIDQRKVESRAMDPHIAVKVLTVPFVNYTDAMTVLGREIQSLHGSKHPNIAPVMDCERDGDVVFIPMELIAGQSLHDRLEALKGSPSPKGDAMRIIKGITDALEFAHSKNILHGDLKPNNVLISNSNVAKVTDFSLARLMALTASAPSRMTRATGRMKALPPSYASPEVLEVGRLDPRDDVFALACIAWKLLTGEHPFKGKSALAAREAGLKLARPGNLSDAEFNALAHGLEFERNKRTLSPRLFFAELSGKGAGPSGRVIAAIAAIVIAALVIGAYFVLKSGSDRLNQADSAAEPDTAPAQLPPGESFRDCASCPLMKVIGSGEFMQGSTPSDADAQQFEMPQHNVTIAYPFAVGVYEVTVGQFKQFATETGLDAHGCAVYDGDWQTSNDVSWKNATEGQGDSYPVSCVSWQDAKHFAAWLSHKTHHTYRLPSASEWEYAARGGSVASRPWTDPSDACKYANLADQTAAQHFPGWTVTPCADKFVQSAPVGSFAPNALGLYDMLGNVFEWTEDCWADTYVGAPTDGSARTDADCSQRELRGGSWFTQPDYVRVSYRDRFATDYRTTSVGFRLIREISE